MAQRQTVVPQSKHEVLQIPDLKTAMLILKDMGVETKGKGIKNKDDAVNLIMENFNRGAVLPPKPVKVRELFRGYSRTSMAQTTSGPWKYVRDRGSSS